MTYLDDAISSHQNWRIQMQSVIDGSDRQSISRLSDGGDVVCVFDQCLAAEVWRQIPDELGRTIARRHKGLHLLGAAIVAKAQREDTTLVKGYIEALDQLSQEFQVLLSHARGAVRP